MLVTLGARAEVDGVVDLLAACHRRIRQHIVLARRLILQGATSPAQELRETAGQVRRYFTIALPLHIADEDLSIAPRIRETSAELDAAVAQVASDHAEHQHMIDTLSALCGELEREPARLAAVEGQLAGVLDVLAPELARHLELEERIVFPAVRELPASVRSDLLVEVRARRYT
jgi:hypothetical protein